MANGKEIMAIDPSNIPAHLLNRGRKSRNADALNGLSTGGVSSIRVKNGRFRIKETGSDDVAIPAKELADGQYLPVVIVGVRGPVNKVYYAKPYDPNQDEALAPDCFSLDGLAPDPTVENPICASCAGCPMNAFGSGKNQQGQPTKGKACADNKVIAVLYRKKVYSMKVPPASLKNFATYIRELDRHDLDYASVITFISLDDSADYSVLTFRVGKYLTPELLEQIDEISESHDTMEIMNPRPFVKQLPAPDEKAAKTPAKVKKEEAEEADYEEEVVEKKPAKKKAAKKPEPEDDDDEAAASPVTVNLPSDDEINSLLDL